MREKFVMQIATLEIELGEVNHQAIRAQGDSDLRHKNEIRELKEFWEHKLQEYAQELSKLKL